MEIVYLGHASFRIRTHVLQYGWVTIVTDPYDSAMVGLRFPKIGADIITVSHEHRDHSASELVRTEEGKNPKQLTGPGEYEIKGVTIRGVAAFHDDKKGAERGENTIYVIESEGVRIAHLGDLGHKLTDSELSEMGAIDIVFVPVGGIYTIDGDTACEVVAQLEPKVVIPMHYKVAGMKEGFDKLAGADDFIKKMGVEAKKMDKLDVKKNGFPEEMEIVVLNLKSS